MSKYSILRFATCIAFIVISTLPFMNANAGTWRPEATIGGKLRTHVYVPNTAPIVNGMRALMVSMHGCGQTHHDFKQGANWQTTADAYGMVVALPKSSDEGTYGGMGCWNFHVGMSASRSRSDAKYLIDLVDDLLSDPSLNIDPRQVYITGLSSGAGMTNQMACLAPDIFAGAGVNAGPAPGSGGTDLSRPGISIPQGKDNCETLAGPFITDLYTQVYNNVHGTNDYLVGTEHAERNTQIFIDVYEGDGQTQMSGCGSSTLSGGGDVTTYCDSTGPRISKVMVNGMGHAWPAGPGTPGGGSYIDHTHINYPAYITDFFFTNNRRITVVVPSPTPTPTGTPTTTPTPSPSVNPTPTATPTPSVSPTPTNPPATSCTDVTNYNYYHKVANRALSSGNFLSPNYFAKGSGDAMPGSTWGLNTLYTADGGSSWYLGNCP